MKSQLSRAVVCLLLSLAGATSLTAQNSAAPRMSELRARDLGIPFDGTTGGFNAITDVPGVEVGFKTLVSGEGRLVVGKGPVRTGVTAILPREFRYERTAARGQCGRRDRHGL